MAGSKARLGHSSLDSGGDTISELFPSSSSAYSEYLKIHEILGVALELYERPHDDRQAKLLELAGNLDVRVWDSGGDTRAGILSVVSLQLSYFGGVALFKALKMKNNTSEVGYWIASTKSILVNEFREMTQETGEQKEYAEIVTAVAYRLILKAGINPE
ncbi:hypothetical protein BDQ12DRAFT_668045 [Crucibulum laeve]|uniref:Uncharacterized protein n=1 Tax=Crucibulum laeve TaxID=68775 RepID=A0A5C3LU78_9AGAR|nr:hypothetical protein BDQ12DRAFT_668045 [Crucibulum laeve]